MTWRCCRAWQVVRPVYQLAMSIVKAPENRHPHESIPRIKRVVEYEWEIRNSLYGSQCSKHHMVYMSGGCLGWTCSWKNVHLIFLHMTKPVISHYDSPFSWCVYFQSFEHEQWQNNTSQLLLMQVLLIVISTIVSIVNIYIYTHTAYIYSACLPPFLGCILSDPYSCRLCCINRCERSFMTCVGMFGHNWDEALQSMFWFLVLTLLALYVSWIVLANRVQLPEINFWEASWSFCGGLQPTQLWQQLLVPHHPEKTCA